MNTFSYPPVIGTPLEVYQLHGREVRVKREDLCTPDGIGPALEKYRGVYEYIRNRPDVEVFGVLDGKHSRNGWCVALAARSLGREAHVYYPRTVAESRTGALPRLPQAQAHALGAKLTALPAGRQFILQSQARTNLRGANPGRVVDMLPNGLKTAETTAMVKAEAERTFSGYLPDMVVVSVGGGGLASGVLEALWGPVREGRVILTLVLSYPNPGIWKNLSRFTGIPEGELNLHLNVVMLDGKYGEAYRGNPPPFPSSPYYEAHAWGWLEKNLPYFSDVETVCFWNAGQ